MRGVPDMPMAAYPIHPFCFCSSFFSYLPCRFASPSPLTVSLPTGRLDHDSRGANNSSSEIGSDKVILLHNKAHGEAEKTEGKNITEVPTAQESDREVTYGAFIFGINTIHNSHRQMS